MNAVVRLEPPITPRADQLDALDAILDALDRGLRRPLVEAPCAWGKSVLIAMLALALVQRGQRVLILAHRHELLEQNTGALLRLDPAADVGICSASLRSDRLDAAIVVGGTATIFRRLQRLGSVDAVLLDECFPAGTLIDGRPIEIVRPGNIVRTFDSATRRICTGRVVRVFSRVCRTVAVLTFQSGRRVAATLNHPILTTKGWINAGTLAPGCDVYVDPMHRVRHADTATKPAPLRVVESDGQSLLLSRMRPRCEAAKSRATFRSDEAAQSDVCGRPASEDAGDPPGNRPSAVNPWRERQATTATADDFVGGFGTGLDCRAFGPNLESPQAARNALALQDRHRASGFADRHRDRWPEPQPQYQEAVGREEGRFLAVDRLVSAEVLEQGRDVEFDAVCPGGLVYNFEVEGTHTYFAAGVAAHNCHLLGPGSASMLGTILKSLDDPPLIGFTATPYRTDSGSLVSAELFDEIVWRMGVIEAIDAGLLVPLITKSPKAGRIDTTYVPIERGEFQQRPLEQAALAGNVTRDAVVRTLQVAAEENRTAMLFFAIGVAHCEAISAALREHGITHAVITGDTPTEERAEAIARFRAGKLPALVNCNVLTTGFDARNINLIAFMRPTVSPVLWTQAAGRGMRTWPSKTDCRLLDFGGNIQRHGPINAIRLRPQGARHDAQAAADRVRICLRCDEINEITTAVCTSCGMVLIKPRVSTITTIESTAPAIDAQANLPRWVRVHTMRGGIHEKPGRPPSFRLRYSTEEGWVSEFLSFEHEKPGARWYAGKAWSRLSRTPGTPAPSSARDAYQRFIGGELREPQRLRIERDGQWWRVVDVERATS